ncbi:hypothetical protein M408DRAFT_20480 [Serendipita vermifera MAFF 305830]|uniref:Uncharacterized protein n=1 Tax=Serendipita vermifera MAFF 305830 TaxID=933852 RepID=A0A0C2X1L3_SERVB|nr:hypothetical protein M408DRAFT_20480 [Serendipita vermifera MAFF 305830]
MSGPPTTPNNLNGAAHGPQQTNGQQPPANMVQQQQQQNAAAHTVQGGLEHHGKITEFPQAPEEAYVTKIRHHYG